MKLKYITLAVVISVVILSGCSVQKTATTTGNLSKIERFAQDTLFKTAHVGFVLLDEKTGKYVEEYNADKYFVPASNTKLFTTYAALKYLKDSLPGFYYHETKDTLYLKPNADPTFLNRDFKEQKVFDKIRSTNKAVIIEKAPSVGVTRLGNGWAWINYQSGEMPERTVMPIYANVVKFKISGDSVIAFPRYFQSGVKVRGNIMGKRVNVSRNMDDNTFVAVPANSNILTRSFTHKSDPSLAYRLLQDTLKSLNLSIKVVEPQKRDVNFWKPFHTQKTDDVLSPMMHDSNNFLAEHMLIMAGTQINGQLNEQLAISYLTKNDLSDLSTKFIWYDGSGWSRYNNVTPRAITDLLVKMKKEFGWKRISGILQKGNEGTVKGYYKGYENNIYTKTGTLGNNVISLSGYIITKKGNNYIFSLIANNQYKSASAVRKAFETFITDIIENQ